MSLNLTRAVLVLLILTLVPGCATITPTPTPAPTAVVVQSVPTQTPYPTATLYPTYTPYPTATRLPTQTPIPIAISRPAATRVPECVDNVFRLKCLYAEQASKLTTVSAPVVALPPAPPGSADLWQTPGVYPIGSKCVTYGSSFAGREWQETFCIIKVEIYRDATHNAIRFYGHWQIKLVVGTPKDIMFHPNSRDVTYVVDNLGNKYVPARYGGAADADVKVYGNDYLLGYKDNDSNKFPHEPSAWWEFVPAQPGASSFTFVNDKSGFRIGPIVLSR